MFMALSILVTSLAVSLMIFKSVSVSWISFVTIMTFSSGMMTLFIYTTSMTSNEASKMSKGNIWTLILIIVMIVPSESMKTKKESMKMFSSSMIVMLMATILIITMLNVSKHGHHPNQTISSSF